MLLRRNCEKRNSQLMLPHSAFRDDFRVLDRQLVLCLLHCSSLDPLQIVSFACMASILPREQGARAEWRTQMGSCKGGFVAGASVFSPFLSPGDPSVY